MGLKLHSLHIQGKPARPSFQAADHQIPIQILRMFVENTLSSRVVPCKQ